MLLGDAAIVKGNHSLTWTTSENVEGFVLFFANLVNIFFRAKKAVNCH